MEIHEFYLENYNASGVTEKNKVYRIVLGDLINSETRSVFKSGFMAPDLGAKTGSIGFLDLLKRDELVPKKYPGRHLNEDLCKFEYMETRNVATILTIGVEPKYRKNPLHALSLIERAKEIVKEWGLKEIVAHTIDRVNGDKLLNGLVTLGYCIYDENMGIKRV